MNLREVGARISREKLRMMARGVMRKRSFSTIVAGGISLLSSEEKAELIAELRREGVEIPEVVSDAELKIICSSLMGDVMRMANC